MEDRKIGANLRAIRTAKNLTQQDMADRLNISQAAYRKFELDTNSPKVSTLVKIARALDVDLITILEPTSKERAQQDEQIRDLIKQFSSLNKSGKEKALDLVGLLTEIDRLKE